MMSGYSIPFKSLIVLSYGGLRGAIALSLSMILALDLNFKKEARDLCLVYIVSTIVFTVCINGSTIKFLMKAIGFLQKETIKEKLHYINVKRVILNTF